MLVVTADQRDSRRDIDRVDDLLDRIDAGRSFASLVRPFERTAGDEVQGMLEGHDDAVRLALDLVRDGHWNVGIGLGAVDEPIPGSVRAAAGPAFVHAREAVARAKSSPRQVAVIGPDTALAGDAEALLALLAAIVQRRTPPGWEVVDLMVAGMTQQEAAKILGVSAQAVSQRLHTALWRDEERARPVAGRLLREADT